MTYQEQIEFLGKDKIQALSIISDLMPDFQLTGSISLIEWNVCKRQVSDIDIVVSDFDLIATFLSKEIKDIWYSYDYEDETQSNNESFNMEIGIIPNRAHFEINNVKVCIFFGKDQEYKICKLGDKEYKISHPRYAIEAKERYLKDLAQIKRFKGFLNEKQIQKMTKHYLDIMDYEIKFGTKE